jgi:hypothetical protein
MKALRYIVFAALLLGMSCEMSDDENHYKLVIFSYFGSFIGTYTVDSDIHVIRSSDIVADSGIYTYSKGLGRLTNLDVDIAGDTSTTFLKVVLYQNDEKVDSASANRTELGASVSINFSYAAPEVN